MEEKHLKEEQKGKKDEKPEVVRGKDNLQDLLKQIPKGHKPEEFDWGPPVGREEW